jgi:hypothetical protein
MREATVIASWVQDVLTKIEYGATDQCWRWKGYHDVNGRPQQGTNRAGVSQMVTHRVLAIFTGCPVPDGCEAHHTCETPWCVNPWHLRVLTQTGHRQQHRKAPVACRNGHDYTPENTGWTNRPAGPQRYCKQCNRERAARNRRP